MTDPLSICGMDTTDPKHQPAICEAVANTVCKEGDRVA